MKSVGLAQLVANSWVESLEDNERRRVNHVTELHRWVRARNGRWVDRGYMMCPSRDYAWWVSSRMEP